MTNGALSWRPRIQGSRPWSFTSHRIARLAAPAVIAVAALCGGAAAAQKSASEGTMGSLSPFLIVGEEGPWRGAITGGTYVLENRTDSSDVRYFYGGTGDAGRHGHRDISVTVDASSQDKSAFAGLLYGFQADPRLYYAYVVRPSGEIALLRRDAGGLNAVMATDDGRTGTRTLRIVEQGETIQLFVDGRSIGSLASRGTGRGAVGIIAGGTGRFVFSGFTEGAAGN